MKEKGSVMILAIIATMILSIILAAGLMVTTTESATTQNLYMNKASYYWGILGLEQIADKIRVVSDPSTISSNTFFSGLVTPEAKKGNFNLKYITGTMKDMEDNTVRNVEMFKGFAPPPIPSVSQLTGISPTIWHVRVTSQVVSGKKKAYTEVEAGIYSVVYTGY